MRGPKTRLADLTDLQRQVVLYCLEHDVSPWKAAVDGICSRATIQKWRIANIRGWIATEQRSRPKTLDQLAEEAQSSRNALLSRAIRVLEETLETGEGNATAVRLSQWIIEGIVTQAATAPEPKVRDGFPKPNPEAELADVLRLVRRK